MAKPALPKGTRDFSTLQMARRQYMLKVLEETFKRFAFQAIETPAMELSETLMGKYGDEGDRLIFRILNSGDYLAKADGDALKNQDSKALANSISEKALRYDLTVPFARFVVQHRNDLVFPFKRYQIQPVWRADRPQKGRFREFYQCDADVVGSRSLWQEVELIQLYDSVFTSLGLTGISIKMNNRKILAGLAEIIGAGDKLIPFTVALDKLDKIGKDKVEAELRENGISDDAIARLQPLFTMSGTNLEQLEQLEVLMAASSTGLQGIDELRFICNAVEQVGLQQSTLGIDLTLARGLNYYTGAIFEVAPPEGVKMGSIGGGGRYDDLTGVFGLNDVSGVGVSFGLDRIYLVMEELGLFPEQTEQSLKALFINFGEKEALYATKAISKLRTAGVVCELYPDAAKMKKQMSYADKRNVPYVILCGTSEMAESKFTLKQMATGEQEQLDIDQLLSRLSDS